STAYLPKTTTKNVGFSLWKPIRSVFNFLRGNALFTTGLLLLLGLYIFGVIGSQLTDVKMADMGANPLNLKPSWEHPLGTEGFGRDVFTLVVHGIPNTFKIGILAGGLGMLIGSLIGLFAGYYGGFLDVGISSFADVLLVIPSL